MEAASDVTLAWERAVRRLALALSEEMGYYWGKVDAQEILEKLA